MRDTPIHKLGTCTRRENDGQRENIRKMQRIVSRHCKIVHLVC